MREGNTGAGFAVMHIFKDVFVPHKFFAPLLFACALFAFPAFAQTGAALKDAPALPAGANADVLTPDQAKRALDTLQDDNKRAQIMDTLRAIGNASPQAQAAPERKPPHHSRRTAFPSKAAPAVRRVVL